MGAAIAKMARAFGAEAVEAKKRTVFSMAEWDDAFAAATDIREWTDGPDPEWWSIHRLARALLESRDRMYLKSDLAATPRRF